MNKQKDNIQRIAINLIENVEINSINNIPIVQIIEYLKKNCISLLDLNCSNSNQWFFSTNEFKNNLLKEESTAKLWRDSSIDLLKEWEENGIEYVFHKSIGEFPVASENLDVLVKRQKFKKAGEILEHFNYINARNIQEPHKEFYRKFEGDKIVLPVHLHERVCWSVPYDDIDHIWNNYQISKVDPILHYPAVEDSIIIILDKNDIDWSYIENKAENLKWDHSFFTILIIFEHHYSKLFNKALLPQDMIYKSNEYVRNKKWIISKLEKEILVESPVLPFKISHLWTRIHTSLRELRDPFFGNKLSRFYQVFSGLFDRFIHLKLKFHNHPGFVVAISGLDGSGKTKYLHCLKRHFNECEIKSTIKWHRVGSLSLTQFVLKLIRGNKDKGLPNCKKSENMEVLSKNALAVTIWEWLNFIDLLIFYFFKVQVPKKLRMVVLCDRHILDDIIDFESLRKTNNNNRIFYKIIMRFFPKPDLYFLLNTPIEIIKSRTKEKIAENINQNSNIYSELKKQIGIEIVDNSQSFNIASQKFTNESLSMFFSKFPDKYKGYKVISFRYK